MRVRARCSRCGSSGRGGPRVARRARHRAGTPSRPQSGWPSRAAVGARSALEGRPVQYDLYCAGSGASGRTDLKK